MHAFLGVPMCICFHYSGLIGGVRLRLLLCVCVCVCVCVFLRQGAARRGGAVGPCVDARPFTPDSHRHKLSLPFSLPPCSSSPRVCASVVLAPPAPCRSHPCCPFDYVHMGRARTPRLPHSHPSRVSLSLRLGLISTRHKEDVAMRELDQLHRRLLGPQRRQQIAPIPPTARPYAQSRQTYPQTRTHGQAQKQTQTHTHTRTERGACRG
jgi:hypothetical protein